MLIKYRPEIDGLRAVAVLAVILYHANFTLGGSNIFKGGFIGVDIFFVISGYLITLIIFKEISQESFSFMHFYERRIRRIIPPLVAIMIFSIPFSWLFIPPKALNEYAGSILSSLFFSSNIWFSLEDDYWAEASSLKPFLHTWSLSVEEQFYIIFPCLLLFLWKKCKNYITHTLILFFLVSLYYSHTKSNSDPLSSFYLLQTRAWELLAGAILAITAPIKKYQLHPLNKMMPMLGLCLILGAIIFFDNDTPHPSPITLIPIIGTMIIIYFSQKGEIITKLLSFKLMTKIGLISYSLYLWHFPVFAFFSLNYFHETLNTKVLSIVITFIASYLTYKLIEQPYRKRFSTAKVKQHLSIGILCIATYIIFVLTTDGVAGRNFANKPLENLWALDRSNVENQNSSIHLINIGDSHAGTIMGSLRQKSIENNFSYSSILSSGILPLENVFYIANGKLIDRYGLKNVNKLLNSIDIEIKKEIKNQKEIYMIFSSRFPLYLSGERPVDQNTNYIEKGGGHFFTINGKDIAPKNQILDSFKNTVKRWSDQGANIVIVYPVPEMIYNIPRVEFQNTMLEKVFGISRDTKSSVPLKQYQKRIEETQKIFDSLQQENILRVYPEKIFCNHEKNTCTAKIQNKILYRDDDHLSDSGSALLVNEIFKLISIKSSTTTVHLARNDDD